MTFIFKLEKKLNFVLQLNIQVDIPFRLNSIIFQNTISTFI